MNSWSQYRIKDLGKFISTKTSDLTLPYIALDNIASQDAAFVSKRSAHLCHKLGQTEEISARADRADPSRSQ